MSNHPFTDILKHPASILRTLIVLLVLLAFGSLLTACQAAGPEGVQPGAAPAEDTAPSAAAPETGQLPRNETFYVAGMQWGPFITFNPLAPNQTWPSNGESMLLYEALFAFNVATGELEPLLGKELTFTDDTTIEITLQDAIHWQDGTPLTIDDVIFTFELAQTHDDLRYSLFWDYVSEMAATGDKTIEIKLNPDQVNAGLVLRWLSDVRILPQHIWAERESGDTPLSQIVDDEPVGSGPYKVLDYSVERIALVRDDNYWGIPIFGTPARAIWFIRSSRATMPGTWRSSAARWINPSSSRPRSG